MPTEEHPEEKKPRKEILPYWKRQLARAEKKLKDKGGEWADENCAWRNYVKFYEGEQWIGISAGESRKWDRITANIAKSNIDVIRPQLYFQNPKVRVSIQNPEIAAQPVPETDIEVDPMTGMQRQVPQVDPATGQPKIRIPAGTPVATVNGQLVDATQQTELIEQVDNYYLDEMDAKMLIRRVINDALILPYGVLKLEWVVEFEEGEDVDDQGMPTGKKTEKVAYQYPKLSRVKPWCLLWDPDLEEFNFDSCRWIAEVQYLTKEETEKIPDIKVDWKEISAEFKYTDPEDFDLRANRSGDNEDSEPRYKVYQIHDLAGKNYYVWVQGSAKLNRIEEPSYYDFVEESIYTVLGFDETPGDSFPIPKLAQIRTKAQAYNKIVSYQVNHVGRYNRKYGAVRAMLDGDTEVEKLERGGDGSVIMLKDMAGLPLPIADANINPDVYRVADALKREITEDIGVTAYGRGSREPGVDTAYEANLIQGGSDIKVQEMRDCVREFVRKIVRKLNAILKKYADQPQVIRIAGSAGERWVRWTAEDIRGEYLEDVDIYSSMPFAPEVAKKQALETVTILSTHPAVNQQRLIEWYVKEAKIPENILKSQAEMQQEQQAAMQQQQQQQAIAAQNQVAGSRPRPEEARNRNDMMAGIVGPARRM